MATLLDLRSRGELKKVDPDLGPREQEWRHIFALPRVEAWIADRLPGLESAWQIEERPIEQLDSLVYQFCSDEPLAYGHRFKPLTHLGDGVWELKTADLRLFGWFFRKDCYVCSDIDLKRHVVDHGLVPGYVRQAVRFRECLELDEPKFIAGDDPNDVVSNCYYP